MNLFVIHNKQYCNTFNKVLVNINFNFTYTYLIMCSNYKSFYGIIDADFLSKANFICFKNTNIIWEMVFNKTIHRKNTIF